MPSIDYLVESCLLVHHLRRVHSALGRPIPAGLDPYERWLRGAEVPVREFAPYLAKRAKVAPYLARAVLTVLERSNDPSSVATYERAVSRAWIAQRIRGDHEHRTLSFAAWQ